MNSLTRQSLLDALAAGPEVTAQGILAEGTVLGQPTTCWATVQVQGGAFVRVDPAGEGEFACDDSAVVQVVGDFQAVVIGSRQTRQRLRGGAVILGAVVGLVYVAVSQWAGNAVTFSSVLAATVAGVAAGAIYALAATGLVVTYTTSGIFNFAQGAIGMFMAFVYWQLTQEMGLAELPAIVLVVGVIAPAAGVFLDRFAMNRAARSGLVVQLMATVALMVFLMGLAAWIWNQNESRSIPYLFGSWIPHRRDVRALAPCDHDHAGVVIAIGLRLFLRRSRTGLAMRAVVDSPTLAAMHGATP